MKLPAELIASGKAQLQSLWDDTVTVTRKEQTGNIMDDVVKYQSVKCHLSQSNAPMLNQTDTVATTTSVFTLYVDTSVYILSGDSLIITHKGQVFEGIAGEPFNRNFSNGVKVEVSKIS